MKRALKDEKTLMEQRKHPAERDEYLIAKALHIAINMYHVFPEELRPEGDRADMTRILRERFPKYARILEELQPHALVV